MGNPSRLPALRMRASPRSSPPGSDRARKPARSAATRSSRSRTGTVRDRLASGDLSPAGGARLPARRRRRCSAPVPRPRAIFGIGRNYAAHAAELGNELPEAPIVFMKLPTSSVPPAGPVRCPAVVSELDYEAELAVVIGARRQDRRLGGRRRRQRARPAGRASSSGRAPRASTPRARGARGSPPPTSCPTPRGLRIQSWVNGEQRQDATPHDLIFGPQRARRLHRRDLHAGARRPHPHRHARRRRHGLRPAALPRATGDVVRIEIERLGSIEHAGQCSWMTRSIRPYSAA